MTLDFATVADLMDMTPARRQEVGWAQFLVRTSRAKQLPAHPVNERKNPCENIKDS